MLQHLTPSGFDDDAIDRKPDTHAMISGLYKAPSVAENESVVVHNVIRLPRLEKA
ncbi:MULTISPECIES: hypothetical protein [Methylobacterium]|uniref:hypothetical protein n=1 Tax=Methylobacterium TaxID=407 RepID=UPI000ABCD915|nr:MULTISPECIES: hypothetical protein [Methylobacterium]MCI9881123.1 hypothetical protein [Methylobacterium goesingense]